MKKFICLLTFLLSISLVGCGEESNQDFYMPTDVTIVNGGEFTWFPEITITSADIEKLIPEQYSDYDTLEFSSTSDKERIYVITTKYMAAINYTDDLSQNIFSFNVNTSELKHIIDISNLKMSIGSILEVNGNIYISSCFPDLSYGLFTLKENELILLSDKLLNTPIKHEDSIAFVEIYNSDLDIVTYNGTTGKKVVTYDREKGTTITNSFDSGFDVVKHSGTKRKKVIMDYNFETFRGLFSGTKLAWLTGVDLPADNREERYLNILINDEIRKYPIPLLISPVKILSDVYIYTEISRPGMDVIYIKNFKGEEVARFTDEELWIYSTNYDDIFVFGSNDTDTNTQTFTMVKIDEENRTITSSVLNIDDLKRIYASNSYGDTFCYTNPETVEGDYDYFLFTGVFDLL